VSVHFKKFPPALKHAGYSATTLLPGENRAAFEKLHRALVAELVPVGALEEDVVADLARLIWRKQNLDTCRIAELAKARRDKIEQSFRYGDDSEADDQAREELGDVYELIDLGESATLEGLMKELDVADRLQGMIDRCLKRLLVLRGVKSLSSAVASDSPPQIAGPREAD
jgi:hypothetical protein